MEVIRDKELRYACFRNLTCREYMHLVRENAGLKREITTLHTEWTTEVSYLQKELLDHHKKARRRGGGVNLLQIRLGKINQCSGSKTFRCGFGSADPCL